MRIAERYLTLSVDSAGEIQILAYDLVLSGNGRMRNNRRISWTGRKWLPRSGYQILM